MCDAAVDGPFGREDAWSTQPSLVGASEVRPERLATEPLPGRAWNMRQGRLKPHAGSRSVPDSRIPPQWRQPTMRSPQAGGGGIGCVEAMPRRLSRTGRSSSRRSRTMSCCTRRYASVSSACGEAPVVRSRSALRAGAGHRGARGSDPTLLRRHRSGGPLRRPRPGAPEQPTLRERISGSCPQSVQATTVLAWCPARGGRCTTRRSPSTLLRSPSIPRSRSARVLERCRAVDSVVRSALRDPS